MEATPRPQHTSFFSFLPLLPIYVPWLCSLTKVVRIEMCSLKASILDPALLLINGVTPLETGHSARWSTASPVKYWQSIGVNTRSRCCDAHRHLSFLVLILGQPLSLLTSVLGYQSDFLSPLTAVDAAVGNASSPLWWNALDWMKNSVWVSVLTRNRRGWSCVYVCSVVEGSLSTGH